eukprot:1307172-Pleurochrysis_carterae.AAC.3
MAQLRAMAKKFGVVVQPFKSFQHLFAQSVANCLKVREVAFVYQAAAFYLINFQSGSFRWSC